MRAPLYAPTLLALALLIGPASPRGLEAVLGAYPADSLVPPLRRFELDHAGAVEAGEAAFVLGQLHFARGEYRQACDAFGRAAARLVPARKPAARYAAGLCWLALRDAARARATLEEVAQSSPELRSLALLGVAQAWELVDRPERAMETLDALLAGDPGEAGPPALERVTALAARVGSPDRARRARERLRRDYPGSIEAARATMPVPAAEEATAGVVEIQIGAFADPARARSLAERARRAGFPSARVVTRGDGPARVHVVRLGTFGSNEEAVRAGARAARELGVSVQIVHPS